MYLSKLVLRPKEAVFKDVYDAHQAIWELFADEPGRKRDFLFREIDAVTYLVLSARAPVDARGIWTVAVKPYTPHIKAGDRLYVSLRANAVVKRRDDAGRQNRFDVVQDERRRYKAQGMEPPSRAALAQECGLKWLLARQESMGLAFEDENLLVEGYLRWRYHRGGKSVRFSTLDFAGFASVADADKALAAMLNGVGPAKGFGCGLMLARRA